MKKIFSKIFKVTIVLMLFVNIGLKNQTYADVGGIQRYDSSSPSSSSSSSS